MPLPVFVERVAVVIADDKWPENDPVREALPLRNQVQNRIFRQIQECTDPCAVGRLQRDR